MNQKTFYTLEYNKIIAMLENFTGSSMGKDACRKLEPYTDILDINDRQEETQAALSRIYRQGGISFSGLIDIRPSVKRLQAEASLSIVELLDVARVLDTVSNVKKYGDGVEEGMSDCLSEYFEMLMPLEHITREIRRCILSADEIADDASSALKDVRRNIKLTNDKVHSQLANIVNSQANAGILQDNIVTMRNGRYCIPVKVEHKNSVAGMLHDQSSTGSTVFIEPMAIVNLNNQLKELANKEQIEIEKILMSLSAMVAAEADFLIMDVEHLAKLDFIFARASFAKSYTGTKPIFNTDGIVEIKKGRHPLLNPKKVVPIDLTLGEDYNMLIITGPNTGGKTVSLKTLGLFTLMGQSGLHIPAFEGSRLAVFDNVLADIGDEQSIEQSLSTFSSHMTGIVSILEEATPNSLILFDELGGGTDPVEGAALAISILNEFLLRGNRVMATTHYSELKLYALSTEGVENASCEFDLSSLQPTYRLIIGIPGKSNAFAISKKLGLPDYIIEHARAELDTNAIDFETLMADLEESRKTIEAEQAEITRYKEETLALKKQLEEKQATIDKRKEKIIEEAKEEAAAMLEEAKKMADASIRQFHYWERHPEKANIQQMEKKRGNLGNKLKGMQPQKEQKPVETGTHRPEDFKLGDSVHVFSMNIDGVVTGLPNHKGELMVQMGILNSSVAITDVKIIASKDDDKYAPRSKKRGGSYGNLGKTSTISPEINLLGLTVDEAIAKLDKYLDDACLSHLNQVRVIHGKGTGALRKGIQTYLKTHPLVKSFRAGEFGEGDMGVTIVEL